MPIDDTFLARKEYSIQRVFAGVTPGRVWTAWTEPAQMARWMWGSLGKETWAQADVRVGGAYRVYTHTAGGKHEGEGWSGMLGFYVVVEPNHRLVYTGHWDADVFYNQDGKLSPDEVIDVTFEATEDDGGGTKVTVWHRGIPDVGDAWKHHQMGFGETLDFLGKLLQPTG